MGLTSAIKGALSGMKEGWAKSEPPGSEDTLNKNIDLILSAGTAHLRQWLPYYRDGHNYLWNNQLADHKRLEGWDRIQENQIFPAAQQQLSLLSLQRPKFLAHPREQGDMEGAAIWEQVLQWEFEEGLKVPRTRLNAKLDGQSAGHFVDYLWWDDEAEWDAKQGIWKGRLRHRLLKPSMFVMDPDAEGPDALDDAEYAYYFYEVPLAEARMNWPKYADEIDRIASGHETDNPILSESVALSGRPRIDDSVTLDGSAVKGERATAPTSDMEGRLARLLESNKGLDAELTQVDEDGSSRRSTVTCLMMFMRDRTREKKTKIRTLSMDELVQSGRAALQPDETGREIYFNPQTGLPLSDADQTETTSSEVPKYPYGRYILRIGAKTILEDRPWHLPKWPFVLGVNIQLPHTWHGLNAAEMSHGMQDFKNIVWANMANYVKFFGQPVTLVEAGAVQGSPGNENIGDALPAKAGAIWKVRENRIGAVKRVDPPQLGPTIFQILEKNEASLKDTLGMQDISLGKKQPGEQTATEALELQTNSKVRTALENLNMDVFTLDLMKAAHMFLNYHLNEGDIVRIVGQAGQTAAMTAGALDAEFDLKMEVGTVLPFDQERERMKADRVLEVLGPSYMLEWLKAYDVKEPEEKAAQGMQYQAERAAQTQPQGASQGAQSLLNGATATPLGNASEPQ